MRKANLFSLLIVALILGGWFAWNHTMKQQQRRAAAWSRVKVGLTVDEVTAILGEPETVGGVPADDGVETFSVYPDGMVFFQKAVDGTLRVKRIEKK